MASLRNPDLHTNFKINYAFTQQHIATLSFELVFSSNVTEIHATAALYFCHLHSYKTHNAPFPDCKALNDVYIIVYVDLIMMTHDLQNFDLEDLGLKTKA